MEQDISVNSRHIFQAPSSIAMFVGYRSGLGKFPAFLITSKKEYDDIVALGKDESEMSHQIDTFFKNGGHTAYVANVSAENGSPPKLEDYSSVFSELTKDRHTFNLLILPRHREQSDLDMLELYRAASAFAEKSRCFLLMDPPAEWRCPEDIVSADMSISRICLEIRTKNAAIFWPTLRVETLTNGSSTREIGPSGAVAGVIAKMDSTHGPWRAPAGLSASTRGIIETNYSMSNDENTILNENGVNAIRDFPTDTVIWGARTLGSVDGDSLEYKYIPTRRLALMIEESLDLGLEFAKSEKNGEPLWAQMRLVVGAFMHQLFREKAFKGEKASDAYFIQIDSHTTTEEDIKLGLVNVVVGFAHVKPQDFTTITIQKKTMK